ncbi:MAG: cobalamin B12-binding domain-containing protein [Planctomycetes bacterium]|nr:cobalamin B12-binding domain-containing protein [Planctomycetota bacterium]
MAESGSGACRVGLVQVNNSFSGQNYLPYSVGLLQAYVQRHAPAAARYEFLLPLYKRVPVEEAVRHLRSAEIVGFSVYVWNIEISLAIARRLKALRPDLLIVFGGPHVPDRAEAFLRRHPFIDLACHGEGEATFLQVLEHFPERAWEAVPSLSYLAADGAFVHHPKAARLRDLSVIPSPYLAGVFDPLMRACPEERWLILWETNRGCPFSCTFCDWGSSIASKVFQFDLPRLSAEIDWFAARKIEFIFCCDANFGILPRDLDLVKLAVAAKQEHGYPQALSVQNTKNATERAYQAQKMLADAGLNKGVTLSLQSTDAATLKAVKRDNISLKTYEELQRRFARDRIETYSDMILGMPEETYESFVNGISQVVENGQHNRIQFNNLAVLPNAEMGDPAYQQKYGMVLKTSKIINIHGSLLTAEDEVQEYQELVIATHSMPPAQWARTRAFCWMVAFLHFDKIFQIPLILAHEECGIEYRRLFEAFSEGDLSDYPILRETMEFFHAKALDIQNGGEEYCRSERWLNIYWPADELRFILLCTEGKLDRFYEEAERLLTRFLAAQGAVLPADLLPQAVLLNRSLVKLPFQTEDLNLELDFSIWDYYRSVLEGEKAPLTRGRSVHHIDRTSRVHRTWEEWCEQVVWYGNKKGAYLYSSQEVVPELEGHY